MADPQSDLPPISDLPTLSRDEKDVPVAESSATSTSQFGSVGQRMGDYELLAELGRGAMGIVYKAKQHRLDRTVAIKMLLPNAVAGESELQRFRTEVEATAQFQHANIVRVYEVGEQDGRPFYSMEYVDGITLSQRLKEGPLPSRVAARYLVAITQAIQHAHERGILHRDLKPSNILLDATDQPYVSDFGLAKRVDSDSGQTRTGAVLGTPSYMAPEQALGSKDLSTRTDVYGLGAILYALLTARPPFRAETAWDTIFQVIEQEPAPPRLLNPKIDRDLETICLKCLDKIPDRRYSSAQELAADLERYLSGESIHARSVNLIERLARSVRHDSMGKEFHSWGGLLIWIGIVVVVCHTLAFIASQVGLYTWARWVTGVIQCVLIGIAFWRHRPGQLLPKTSSERQLWSIWIGYLLAFATVALIALHSVDPATVGWSLYPHSAMLAGFAFFVMGNSYWGGCYVIGLAFFVLAAVMPFNLTLAPLEFALLWSIALISMGIRLRRLGRGSGP